MTTRFYENIYPRRGEYVIARVRSISELGAYVSLLEYGDIEGMIPIQELTNRRFRSFQSLTKVGRIEIVSVMRVDPERGFIDLSKRSVPLEDIPPVEERWVKSKTVQSIVARVAELLGIPLLELHSQLTWPLYASSIHPFDTFRRFLVNPSSSSLLQSLPESIQECLQTTLQHRIPHSVLRLRCEIALTCLSRHGVEGIKAALQEGALLSKAVSIRLVSPPVFLMTLDTTEREEGLVLLQRMCDVIDQKICEMGGKMEIRLAPCIQEDNKESDKTQDDPQDESQDDSHDDSSDDDE